MKKKQTADDDPLDREIDFSNGRPNPYFVAYHGPKVIRVLDEDLAAVFPDNQAVNEALRTLVRLSSAAQPQRVSAKTAAAPKTTRKKAGS
ncbi:MAG: hypothetical protein JO197_04940 [Acidobacteria bacterium]|nr:hypothetical protein [Acidobacteriota bacterium]MBV9475197.1 hypothetical protein [Acidobacteriota bacterium]